MSTPSCKPKACHGLVASDRCIPRFHGSSPRSGNGERDRGKRCVAVNLNTVVPDKKEPPDSVVDVLVAQARSHACGTAWIRGSNDGAGNSRVKFSNCGDQFKMQGLTKFVILYISLPFHLTPP